MSEDEKKLAVEKSYGTSFKSYYQVCSPVVQSCSKLLVLLLGHARYQ